MPDKFENQLRRRLEDHPSEVDAFAVWEAVEARLEQKKRRGFIWWLPALLLVAVTATWWNLPVEKRSFYGDELTAFPLPMAEKLQSESGNEGQAINQFQDFGYQSSKVYSATESESKNYRGPNSPAGSEKYHPTQSARRDDHELHQNRSNENQFADAEMRLTSIAQKETPPQLLQPTKPITLPAQTSSSSFSSIPSLETALLALPAQEFLDRKDRLRLNRQVKKNAERKFNMANRPYWSLALEQSVSHPAATQLVDAAEGIPQTERNAAMITELESFSSSLLFGFHLGSKWSLRSGLTYRRINSRTDHQTITTEEFIDPEGITSIRVDESGDTTFTTGPVRSVRTTTGRFRYYNSKTTFDLPVLLGYEFGRKKLRFRLEAGPVINLAAISESTLLGGEEQFFRADNQNGWFRDRLRGLGWAAGAKAVYPITPKTQITLGLRYERTPGSGFENSPVGYRTRYELFGVGLGVARKF